MTVLYGIKSCDTVRKARRWLDDNQQAYNFIDLKATALSADTVQQWLAQLPAEQLLNKRSTTWRQLTATERADLSEEQVIKLLQTYPTLLKRPLIEHQGRVINGFKADAYQEFFHE